MGNEAADDWIRLFNAESEEDLEMIKTEKQFTLQLRLPPKAQIQMSLKSQAVM